MVKRAGLDVIKIHFYHGENVSAGRFGGQKTVFDAIWVCGKNVNNKVSISLKDIFSKVKQEVAELLTRVYQGKFFKLNVDDLKIFVLGKLIEIGGEILTKEKLKEMMYILLEDEELLSFQKRQYLKNQFVQLNLFDKDG
jgi:hypothetical protein